MKNSFDNASLLSGTTIGRASLLLNSNCGKSSISLAPADIKPTNFVHLSRRNKSVIDTWVIDPELQTPETALAKWNLNLAHEGSGLLSAEVYVLPSKSRALWGQKRPRTAIRVDGGTSALVLNLHDASPRRRRDSIHLALLGAKMQVSLPRSFRGPLRLHVARTSITYSPAILANFNPLSEEVSSTQGFLGDFDGRNWKGWAKWKGDEVLALGGAITLQYNDEMDIDWDRDEADERTLDGRQE